MNKNERYYQEYMSHRHVSRRGLFRAFVTASRNVAPPPAALPPWPLPPGTVTSAEFFARCDQCQHCVQACPMGILIARQDGFPQLTIEYASCDGCGKCIQACSGGALQPQPRFDTRLRPSFSDACTHGSRGCEICVEGCPQQACVIGGSGLPEADHDRCNGCGECLIQCDRQAVTLHSVI
ncbi:ferredoxin-type protein NapF [Atlantibacter sp.]|uniref:ferredoxin-type protein NapF n=1 Tax=Atlantibacter sp. TaxID=1903473 RepID=UPI0028AE5F37|nr:ferredoxin-type protein NapF [Atlantibacter sp.]